MQNRRSLLQGQLNPQNLNSPREALFRLLRVPKVEVDSEGVSSQCLKTSSDPKQMKKRAELDVIQDVQTDDFIFRD